MLDSLLHLIIIIGLLLGPVRYGVIGIVKKTFPISKTHIASGNSAVSWGVISLVVGLACIAILVYLNLRAQNLVY